MPRIVLLLSLISFVNLFCLNVSSEPKKVRKSTLAGSWYPGETDSLKKSVDNYLTRAEGYNKPIEGRVYGLISPHAGYIYSGLAAAYGYSSLKGSDISRVIILAPSHYELFQGVSVPDVTHYETPLGEVKVNKAIIEKMRKHHLFTNVPKAHTKEHSLEIQIPMLQRVLNSFEIVPILFGNVKEQEYVEIAEEIKKYVDEKTIIIASSDFTHYGQNYNYLPFTSTNAKSNIRNLDNRALDFINSRDFHGFLGYVKSSGITICGFRPIATLLLMLPKDSQADLLHYYTSGDITGSYKNSVSYVSMAFSKDRTTTAPTKYLLSEDSAIYSGMLEPYEQKTLLELSRKTLEDYVKNKRVNNISLEDYNMTPRLMDQRGVFVTLNKSHSLRGCIGNIIGQGPLFMSVMRNTINSSSHDTRFYPVKPDELKSIDIEISVLSKPLQIKNLKDFIVGKHGIIIKKDGKEAVFLPQVAPEQGWTTEETLTQLSLKAGLSKKAWRESGSKFFVFEAQVFKEVK